MGRSLATEPKEEDILRRKLSDEAEASQREHHGRSQLFQLSQAIGRKMQEERKVRKVEIEKYPFGYLLREGRRVEKKGTPAGN